MASLREYLEKMEAGQLGNFLSRELCGWDYSPLSTIYLICVILSEREPHRGTAKTCFLNSPDAMPITRHRGQSARWQFVNFPAIFRYAGSGTLDVPRKSPGSCDVSRGIIGKNEITISETLGHGTMKDQRPLFSAP